MCSRALGVRGVEEEALQRRLIPRKARKRSSSKTFQGLAAKKRSAVRHEGVYGVRGLGKARPRLRVEGLDELGVHALRQRYVPLLDLDTGDGEGRKSPASHSLPATIIGRHPSSNSSCMG